MKCLNCDKRGHSFQYCTKPIKSFGIIAYKKKHSLIEYLLIQRKDTIGYTDFMRGKYNSVESLKSMVEEMSNEERSRILEDNFYNLWDKLWYNHNRGIYVNEKKNSFDKFTKSNIKDIIKKTPSSRFQEAEYGFPKGRKNINERFEECARREFEEETGLVEKDYEIDKTIPPITESFVGSDGQKYSHVYYIAKVNPYINLSVKKKSDIYMEEIEKTVFLNYKDAYKKIRSYDCQKRYALTKINKILNKKNS